mmetsp:Transcript_63500/g.138302  ORF Transcript_63500/g.138302 Transcript_63500/m.138302 type:complete len:208 (+) Transcript_63500:442-1065(+)
MVLSRSRANPLSEDGEQLWGRVFEGFPGHHILVELAKRILRDGPVGNASLHDSPFRQLQKVRLIRLLARCIVGALLPVLLLPHFSEFQVPLLSLQSSLPTQLLLFVVTLFFFKENHEFGWRLIVRHHGRLVLVEHSEIILSNNPVADVHQYHCLLFQCRGRRSRDAKRRSKRGHTSCADLRGELESGHFRAQTVVEYAKRVLALQPV